MFKADVNVNISLDVIIARLGGNVRAAQVWLDKRVMLDADPFVPYDKGLLAGSVRESSVLGSGKLAYEMPYAKKMYRGVNINFSRDKHPKATHHWIEKAKSVWLDYWGKGVAAILKGTWRRGA